MNVNHLKRTDKSAGAILKHSLFCRMFTIAYFALLLFNTSPSLADSHQAAARSDRGFLYAAVIALLLACALLLTVTVITVRRLRRERAARDTEKTAHTQAWQAAGDTVMFRSEAEENDFIKKIVKGFDNREFKLYMQFIVDKSSKKIVSAEALSRWHDPEDGVVPPVRYIGVMESSGLILRLDYYMFDLVCQQLHRWAGTALGNISISCNITRITISEEDFVDRIEEISSGYVFDHSGLILEITEDAIEKNRKVAMSNIERVKKMGFRIALDDMGSGYTSLVNLCEYPTDIVKIDRDILLKTDTPRGKGLFSGIVTLVHSLGFSVVCEGVETEEQNRLVEETDCDYIQGWYYFMPQPHSECEKIAMEYLPGTE